MKRRGHEDESVDHSPLTRFIDRLVSTFLFLALLVLFIMIFRRVFGTSEIAWIAGLVICFPLAGIACAVIDKAFPALVILLLFASPAVILILVFLMI